MRVWIVACYTAGFLTFFIQQATGGLTILFIFAGLALSWRLHLTERFTGNDPEYPAEHP